MALLHIEAPAFGGLVAGQAGVQVEEARVIAGQDQAPGLRGFGDG
jgi:hypothetical protein